MRVAVAQFATTLNAQENLATCLRMINEAAACKPSLIVLPEFCNTQFCNTRLCHTQPCYLDHNQAWHQALAVNGVFLQTIAEQAKKHHCYIALNVTLRRDLLRDHQNGAIKSNISVSSCLFSPLGELIQQVDKQTLTGDENSFFVSTSEASQVVTTPLGKLAFLSGNEDLTFESSRGLALNGAMLLCHAMSAYALDHSSLYGPARACENKVFLATANKVGALFPKDSPQAQLLSNSAGLSTQTAKKQGELVGVGQSQIVSPDGKILAKMAHNEEGFIFADIDLTEASTKFRPDGTELMKQLRPKLYQKPTVVITPSPRHEPKEPALDNANQVPKTANIAIFATYKSNEQAIEDVCHYIENNLSDIIQLPELFFINDKTVTDNAHELAQIENKCQQLIEQVSAELRPFQYVCTSLVIDGMHQAVIIGEHGLFAKQQQLHFCQRYQWTALGNELNIIQLPLEQGNINLAMLTADDANIPEIVSVAALNGIHLLLVPFDIQTPCEVEFSLLSRAAEHNICIAAASREKNFTNDLPSDCADVSQKSTDKVNKNKFSKNKTKLKKSTGFIATLAQCKSQSFTGYIKQPLVTHQHGKITKALIHPIAACNKVIAKIG